MKSRLLRSIAAAAPAALFCLALQAFPGSAGASSGLSREDLLDLLGAKIGTGVIVRQLESSGLAFRPAAADLVALKKAGASDRLLEAILDAAPQAREDATPPAETVAEARGFTDTGTRVYAATDSRGRRVLVLTNLDETGAKLGSGGAAEPLSMIVRALVEPEVKSPDAPDGEEARESQLQPVIQVIQNAAPIPQRPEPEPPPPAYGSWPGYQPSPCAWGGCNVITTGGAIGAYRYPDRLWFLGYKP